MSLGCLLGSRFRCHPSLAFGNHSPERAADSPPNSYSFTRTRTLATVSAMQNAPLMQKPLMLLSAANLQDLHAGPATGLSFYLFQSAGSFFAVFEDGIALPLQDDARFYCVSDLLQGYPLPTNNSPKATMPIRRQFSTRFAAVAALAAAATISPRFVGSAGAIPLVATATLNVDTIFRRYLPTPSDPRCVGGVLSAGTYLTSELDGAHADSGFGAVGRYALPIPLPMTHIFQYELPAGTTLEVGTVAPNFGQSGGGAEIRLVNDTVAPNVGTLQLSEY